jgi:hypothetical protein
MIASGASGHFEHRLRQLREVLRDRDDLKLLTGCADEILHTLLVGRVIAAAGDQASLERPNPICKTVSAAPPAVDRHLADLASEAADGNARLSCLRSAIKRLARQATEIDAQWSLVRHRSPAWEMAVPRSTQFAVKLGCRCNRRKASRRKGEFHLVISRQLLVRGAQPARYEIETISSV